jgi:hypothetical protein
MAFSALTRGAHVERNNEYIGVAPITVKARTSSRGHAIGRVKIKATDTPTASYVKKRLCLRGTSARENADRR